MKKVLSTAIILIMTILLAVPAMAFVIPISNNVYVFEAGEFESVDGWFIGGINVEWHGNATNSAEVDINVDVAFDGNAGEVIVAANEITSNKDRQGVIDVRIQQTTEEQTVTFTLTKVNKKQLTTTVVVPALYSGPIMFDVLRTANNPGYYYSGALIDMGVTLTSDAISIDSFYAKARITEQDGSVQGGFGNFGWDPEKESYALGDGWAAWNITDVYLVDADGNRVDKGELVKVDIEYETRTVPSGASSAERYDVPATRAAWYTVSGYIAFAEIELVITQTADIPGIASADYIQDETKHDPIFEQFEISEAPGGGTYSLYKPENASEDNNRPIIVWFHGTGERYHGANPGGNLVGNRALSFADTAFQEMLDGCYVLAPQSTSSGWSGSRLDDMEALINQIVSENYVDTDRIYVGGLSMGTGMVSPLILSQTENQISYAAAIFCSGGRINASQAEIIAAKEIPVYMVGNTSDWAASGINTSYPILLAAGVDAKAKVYPAGPVFDGTFYFGAHDSWNYIYNNMVEDEDGETIYEWIARQSR